MSLEELVLLPNKKIRMNDLATLARPTMSYGWTAGRPSKGICSEYNTQLWKTRQYHIFSTLFAQIDQRCTSRS